MKRSWQFGLLAMGLTGVATYNVLFFKDYHSQKTPVIQMEAEKPAQTVVSTVAPAPGMPASGNMSDQSEFNSLPPISKEELERNAQHAFAPKDALFLEEEKPSPSRNLFAVRREQETVKSSSKEPPPSIKQKSTPVDLPEPEFAFSGTLIDQNRRLALIDGVPLSIGARIGAWQIVRIESDNIIVQSGDNTRRIELGAKRQIARKEPL
jgi:hypothetical protein